MGETSASASSKSALLLMESVGKIADAIDQLMQESMTPKAENGKAQRDVLSQQNVVDVVPKKSQWFRCLNQEVISMLEAASKLAMENKDLHRQNARLVRHFETVEDHCLKNIRLSEQVRRLESEKEIYAGRLRENVKTEVELATLRFDALEAKKRERELTSELSQLNRTIRALRNELRRRSEDLEQSHPMADWQDVRNFAYNVRLRYGKLNPVETSVRQQLSFDETESLENETSNERATRDL